MDHDVLEQIRQLKYRYVRFLDLKRWDDWGELLAEDVTATYGDRIAFSNRAETVAYMRENLGPGMITMHHVHHPEIDLSEDGTEATGTWALEDTVIMTDFQLLLTGAAFYEDRYRRRADGRWEIAHTGYVRTFETMQSLADTPSFRLTANRWAVEDGEQVG